MMMMMMMRIVPFLFLACLPLASCSSPPPAASCAGTTTPFCGSACCSAQDDLKLREAFVAEVKAHGYHDPECRSQLKAYICAVCMAAAAPADKHPPSALLPLGCASVVALPPPPIVSTTRHDDELGGSDTGGGASSSSMLCVHKASTQAYNGVVPLNDGSDRLLCWRRNGQIWLATVKDPTATGSYVLRVGDMPVVDLGTRISEDAAARGRGLAGVAVHSSGKLFVSYYTTVFNRDSDGAFLVIDQLPAASWNGQKASRNRPHTAQAKRVFSMALPDQAQESNYCGQILFRPTNADSFLYLVTGPAQSNGQLQAKILRLRVGSMPPGIGSMEVQVYTSVSGIPRRCTFDADKPHDLYCAIVKDEQEVVYLISDGPSPSAMQPSVSLIVAHQRPMPGTPPSIVGGLLYRGYADNTLTGSYIYMEGSEFWWTVALPTVNYTTTRNLLVTCAAPATATSRCHGDDFAGGSVTSFAEDADKNALLLTTDGVYMVVRPSLCDADDTQTEGPILNWILGVIGSLITIFGCYGAYKYRTCSCSCFNRTSNTTVNANNANIHNGEIQLAVLSGEIIHT